MEHIQFMKTITTTMTADSLLKNKNYTERKPIQFNSKLKISVITSQCIHLMLVSHLTTNSANNYIVSQSLVHIAIPGSTFITLIAANSLETKFRA